MYILVASNNQQHIDIIMKTFAHDHYHVAITDNSDDAFGKMTNVQFDVIIAGELDDQEAFLAAVSNHTAVAIRVGTALKDDTKSIGSAHITLPTPIDPKFLKDQIDSAAESHKSITKKDIIKAVSEVKNLPSPPKVFMQLNEILKHDSTDSLKIAEIIIRDPALVAQILHFANSAIMSKGKAITSIPEAITKMGIDTLTCIVMTAELFAYEPDIKGFSLINAQLHSLSTAKLAASLVKPELKQSAILAGLLHDIGKLVLYEMNPGLTKKFFANKKAKQDNIKLEQAIFSTDHAQVGGYLLHMWSIPYPIIEAVILHHRPNKLMERSFGVAHAVYLANKLLEKEPIPEQFLTKYKLEGLMEKLEARADKLRLTE